MLLSLLLCINGICQNKVIDGISSEALPFCTIISKHNPDIYIVSDINGNFKFPAKSNGDTIIIRYVGYDTLIATLQTDKIYQLFPSTETLKEAVIVADDGPAIALIKKVLKRRQHHNILNLDYYQCRIYTRNTIGFDTNLDSVEIKQMNQVFRYPTSLFISESIIDRQYEKREKVYEKIIASDMSGLRDAEFTILPEDVQSLNFYKDYITIFNKDYINPISPLSWLKYHFNLDKVYTEGSDTLYKIDYWPRNVGFNCFKGMIIISDNDWAVQKITMMNSSVDLYPFVLYQEYKRTKNRWFPYKFITEVNFPSAFGKDYPFKMKQTNIFDDIAFQRLPLNAGKVNKAEYMEGPRFNLDSLRMMPLDRRDSTAYVFGDFLFKTGPSGYILRNMQFFINGQLPMGPVALDLASLYSRNLHEKNRFGLGLVSSMKAMPHLGLEGYVAYGTLDKQWKYGGAIAWYFDKLRTSYLKYSWQSDIEGNLLFRFRNQWFNQYYSNLFSKVDKHELSYTLVKASHTITLSAVRENIRPFYSYSFQGYSLGEGDNFINNEISANYQYIKGRQVNFFNTYFITRNPIYPIINVRITAGLKEPTDGNFEYGSIEANFNKIFRWAVIGNTNLTLQGGYTLGQPPIFKLFNAPGARTPSFTISTPYSFQTMPPNQYFSSKYFNIFVQQAIRRLFAIRFSAPELFVSYNAGWGKMDRMDDHAGVLIQDYHKFFHEAGVGMNSIIRIPIADWFAFGINTGAYYNLKSNLPMKLGDNLTIKAGLGFLF